MLSYISEYFRGYSGAAQSAMDVLIALLANQYKVAVYTTKRRPIPTIPGRFEPGHPKWCLPLDRAPLPRPFSSEFPDQFSTWFSAMRGIARQRYFKAISRLVIVNSLANHDFFHAITPRIHGKRVLVVRESPRHYDGPWRLKPLDWAVNAMKDYDRYIFVSSRCRDKWLERLHISEKKAFYIPNCCREDLIEETRETDRASTRKKLGLPRDKFMVVCVGSVQQRKGQDLLVDAFDELVTLIPELFLCLVGSVIGEWGETLCARISSRYPDSIFKCVGKQMNAMEYIHAADLLVLPSRAEAMPRVILEAMALETPVLASNVDGIPELIEDNVTGLLFNHDHPEGMIHGMVEFASNHQKRADLSARARDKYWGHFSREHQIRRFNHVIKDLMSD
ncbi:MAG: glycosyltransferase family 4 protein [Deltaproteobacteria bacterium]|nr:glycosyltransferase family 4 protein [Deltaproteobacteria bacterium]